MDFAPFVRTLSATAKRKTVQAYYAAAKRFEAFRGDRPYTQGLLQDFVTSMSEEGLSPNTIQLYVYGALSFLVWLKENGGPVAEGLKTPRLPSPKDRLRANLTEEALATYMRVAGAVPQPYSTALLLLPLSGLRVGEMCQLKLQDVAVKPPWGYIFSVREGGGQTVKSKSERQVPTLKSAFPILRGYLESVRATLPGRTWLFPKPKSDEHIDKWAMQWYMRRVRAEVGIATLTPHTLRHVFENILEQSGVHGLRIAAIMGHRNLSTTMKYSHPTMEQLIGDLEAVSTPWAKE